MSFYRRVLNELLQAGELDREARTLVIAGGQNDHQVLQGLGFTDVTISNLDERMTGAEYAPYAWLYADAENLPFSNGDFTQVIEHAGLHHCQSPHRALLEMYRVAGQRVLVFENRDSWSVRLATALGLSLEYEIEAVVSQGSSHGGVRNTATPNYIYRWTEREIKKAIQSYDPGRKSSIEYFYGLRLPLDRLAIHQNPWRRRIVASLKQIGTIYAAVLPRQANEFAFLIRKDGRLQPWIDAQTGALAPSYRTGRFV